MNHIQSWMASLIRQILSTCCLQEIARDVAAHSSSVNSLKLAGQAIHSPYVDQHLVKFDAALAQLTESTQVSKPQQLCMD